MCKKLSFLKDLAYRTEFLISEAVIAIFFRLPLKVAYPLCRTMGRLAYWILGERRRITLENIDRAMGDTLLKREKQKIAVKSFESSALSILDLYRVEQYLNQSSEHFAIRGFGHLNAALEAGKGVILAVAHMGSWELLSCIIDVGGINRAAMIVKAIKNPYFDKRITALRKITGVEPIPKTSSLKRILEIIKSGHTLGILIDQWDGPKGLWVPFFGTGTSTTTFPARLAMKTGCQIIPAFCIRTSDGQFEMQFHEPVKIQGKGEEQIYQITEELNRILEEKIAIYPDQWMWGHRRWKEKPDQ